MTETAQTAAVEEHGGGAGTLLTVFGFTLMLAAIFIGLAWYVTELQGGGVAAPSSGIDVERGQALFWGDGACHTCHSFGDEGSAVRCPNLGVDTGAFDQPIGVRAATRKAAEGFSAIEYIIESIYDPNAYVVEGFPKNLMKPIHRPPIALNNDEIASVALYVLLKSEVEIDDATLTKIRAAQSKFAVASAASADPADQFEFPAGDAEAGLEAFTDMRCYLCHRVAGEVLDVPQGLGGVGPDLTSIGAIQTATYMAESIIAPSRLVVADPPGATAGGEGSYHDEDGNSKMPEFADFMTLRQLQDIVTFLATLESEASNKSRYAEDSTQ